MKLTNHSALVDLSSRIRDELQRWRCPIYEARNKSLHARAALLNRRRQRAEVARLRAAPLDGPAHARVLVVIPTYRRPDRLNTAVASALAQSVEDLAVIVVDDGGGLPDNLPDDPRLTAVSLSSNSATLGLVRNVGVDLIDSEFIAFLDDDNQWTTDHLSTAVGALDSAPALDAVYTSLRRLHPDGTSLDVLGTPFDRKLLRRQPFVDANSIVVRRSANPRFSLVPRTKETLPKEDWEYVWRLSRRSQIRHLPAVTVNYTVNPDSYYTDWQGPGDPLDADDTGRDVPSPDRVASSAERRDHQPNGNPL
ncbi:glycosyltransferase family A protein [Gordonia sp. CPCC 205515]|uniref:glycosyltransferase family 2 protein n=1 Tax=Gordonia sp. CPCC 205515 TaxID=3140791 RepID=UPI003AF3CCAB